MKFCSSDQESLPENLKSKVKGNKVGDESEIGKNFNKRGQKPVLNRMDFSEYLLEAIDCNSNEPWKQKNLTGHTGSVNCISYSPSKEFIASGSADTTIKVWNAEN